MLKGLLVTIGDIEGACARRAGGGEVRVIRAEAREVTERLARLLRPYFSFVSRIGVLGGCPIACTDVRSEASRAHVSGGALVVDLADVSTYGCAAFREGADAFVESLSDVTGEDGLVAIGLSGELVLKVGGLGRTLDGWGESPDERDVESIERGLSEFDARRRLACDCAHVVAEYLRCHARVSCVWYPGLRGDPSHGQATCVLQGGFGPIVDFETKGAIASTTLEQTCLERMPEGLIRVVCKGREPKGLVLELERVLRG